MSRTVEPQEVPSVLEYMTAKQELDNYVNQHRKVFEGYGQLAEVVNGIRGQADKEVRALNVSCGPWDRYQVQIKYDAEALYGALGRDGFLEVGGKLNTQTVYEIDKLKVEAAISRGDIPKEIAEAIRTEAPKYHAPKAVEIP